MNMLAAFRKPKGETLPAISQPVSEAAALMEVITKASRDPTVDVEKLERLMAMYERVTAAAAKAAFDAALSEMQPKLPAVDKRGTITINDKNDKNKVIQSTPYALFEDINKAVTPIMAEHGFAMSFRTSTAPDGKLIVTAILSHRAGHREETSLPLMHDSTGSKNSVQAVGSSVSYGKRYTMCALLNINTQGEDTDGYHGSFADVITQAQVNELADIVKQTRANLPKFLAYLGVGALYDIPANRFHEAKTALQSKVKS